ncbi:hypothetical protein L1887_37194 [Cichorium endivia]|nr:hypothetical protein L1887_37194 [Cichorium endivia]
MESIILIHPIAVRLHGCCAESNRLLLVYVCLPQALEISAPTVPALAENVVIPLPNPAYMGSLPKGEYPPSSHHYDILIQIANPRFTSKSLIRSYQRNFNGFAAYLSQEEQQKLAGMCQSFEEAAFTAPLNKVVKCKTQFGWEESVLEDIQPEVSFKIARSGKYLIYNILKLALVALSPPPTVREGVSLLLELIAIHDSMMVPA